MIGWRRRRGKLAQIPRAAQAAGLAVVLLQIGIVTLAAAGRPVDALHPVLLSWKVRFRGGTLPTSIVVETVNHILIILSRGVV
jgi:hypothetical protein